VACRSNPHRPDQCRGRSAPVDTGSTPVSTVLQQGNHQSAPIDTGSTPHDTGSAPVDIGPAHGPRLVFGAIRSPQEHDAKLVEQIGALGLCGFSFHQGDLEDFHWAMCDKLGWCRRKWPAVGRELKKPPGVRKGKVWFNGQRLTVYEIGPASEASVDLAGEAAQAGREPPY
jgi:hypothetical protein